MKNRFQTNLSGQKLLDSAKSKTRGLNILDSDLGENLWFLKTVKLTIVVFETSRN